MNIYRLNEIRTIVARRNAYALPLVDAIRAEADRDASYRATLAEWLVNGGTVTLRDTLAAPFKDAPFVQALACRFRYPFAECWTSIDTAMAKHRLPYQHIWIVKGAVTDPDAHGGAAKIGDTEWQFSDGPPGERGSSADYLSLDAGLRAHAPAMFHFVADDPDEAQGPEGNGYDLPSCRACGHPGSDDHEDCQNCAEVRA